MTLSALKIAPNVWMPRVGLGVFQAGHDGQTQAAVEAALAAGYRHIDTAAIYRNEAEVGAAIRSSGISRDAIFVTTKLWRDEHGYDAAQRAFDRSLTALGLDQVDLYLMHWPVPEKRLETWRALEAIAASGRARAIGVSNFTPQHLRDLMSACAVRPAVNQVEVHPFLNQQALRDFCAEAEIAVAAYSPLTKGRRLTDPALVDLAKRFKRTPAQILLRWGVQSGMAVLPKSSNPQRIRENFSIFDFELDAAAMRHLDGLDDNGRTAWDPTGVP